MVVDYEAAWTELLQAVAEKTQHGREGLLVRMAEIAGRHRVAPGETSRLLRLHGIEVERARQAAMLNHPDSSGDLVAGLASVADLGGPGHHDRGGLDGRADDGRFAAGCSANG